MSYNYYVLAVQNWCSVENQIHGLWADLTPTKYPSFCDGDPFDLVELTKSPQYDKLLEVWSDCTYNDTIALYEHEWSKHGTCISIQTRMTQNEYFEKTLSLFEDNMNGGCFDLQFIPIECLK